MVRSWSLPVATRGDAEMLEGSESLFMWEFIFPSSSESHSLEAVARVSRALSPCGVDGSMAITVAGAAVAEAHCFVSLIEPMGLRSSGL